MSLLFQMGELYYSFCLFFFSLANCLGGHRVRATLCRGSGGRAGVWRATEGAAYACVELQPEPGLPGAVLDRVRPRSALLSWV